MFKRIIVAVIAFAVTFSLTVSRVDAALETVRHTKDDDTWLIYWYLCGANNLEGGGHLATKDIAEMQRVKLPPNVKVLIRAGSTQQWHHPTIQAGGHGIYLYSKNHLEKLVNDNSNMGDPNTLASFLEYGEENFPADHKIIIFWDHGGLNGVCYDDSFEEDCLSYDELNSAFASVYGNTPETTPFELVGFKACLTGSYELANNIAGFSHYMLGAEPTVWDWNFSKWIAALAEDPSMTGAQIGKVICDNALKSYDDVAKRTHTFSIIDLSKMPQLREAYEGYFDEALERCNSEDGFGAAFARAAEARNVDKYSNLYADLGLLAKNTKSIMPAASKKLLKAIDKSVVYNKRGAYLKSKGISTYYPYTSTERMFSEKDVDKAAESRDGYFDMVSKQNINYSAQKELYSELLNLDVLNLEGDNTVLVERKKNGHLFAQLAPEQLEGVSSIQSIIFPVSDRGQFELGGAITISADDLKVNWKKGTVTENFRAVEPMLDGQRIVMYPSVSGRGHTFYTIPILYSSLPVNNDQGESVDLGVQRELIARYDTLTKKYEIVGFGSDIENGMVRTPAAQMDFFELELKPGYVITPLYITISDDPTNELIGATSDRKPLMSVIDKITDQNTGKDFFLKWETGKPFVYTKDTTITDNPIQKGNFFYSFMFNAPNGDNATSYPGVIIVKNGDISRFTTEEFAKAVADAANTSK